MATTTNYGWTTPDDTALVKDGAAAIRSLGTAVDTTTKNLNPSTTLGDIEYRSSTANTNTRLAIGTTGQVLTVAGGVPSWATPAGGSGMVFIKAQSFSASSSVNVNDCFSTTYKNYLVLVNNTAISGNFDLNMRLRVSGSDNTTTNYNCHGAYFQAGSSANTSLGATGDDKWGVGNSINESFYAIWVHAPYASEITGFESINGGLGRYKIMGGGFNATTSFTGFSLLTSSNNMTGTLRVYGLADA